MSPRFDEVRRLADLEKIAKLDPSSNYWEMFKYKMATSPRLLEAAACFQPGDGNLMGELISVMDAYFGEYYRPHKAAMHRLLQAAKIMEEKE